MAWKNITVEIDGVSFLSHVNDKVFTIPFSAGLGVGDNFKAGGKNYAVASVENFMDRNEILIIQRNEVKNDKPKTRRNDNQTGGKDVELQSDDGRPSED